MTFKVAISPCPNDIFIFGPIMRNLIKTSYNFDFILKDVEQLNRYALDRLFDIIKVSYGVIPEISQDYKILTSGGALGHGNGPIIVSKKLNDISQLKGKKIAMPGKHTTAFYLFKHFFGDDYSFVEMRFDKIFDAILKENVEAGIVIHEGRFVYENIGLNKILDLGEIWEKNYQLPIPLGAIAIKKDLLEYAHQIKRLIQDSISYSFEYFDNSKEFCKFYSQELDDHVLEQHITYFVNEYSLDMSTHVLAISKLFNLSEDLFI